MFPCTEQDIRRLRATGSGVSGPILGVSGFGRIKTQVLFFWVVSMVHICFSRFSWAHVLDQNLWTKSLLIVRRSYTQISNIKSNFVSMLEHRLFIPFSRGHASSFDLPVQPHHLHTCLITLLNVHVFLSFITKTHLGAEITFSLLSRARSSAMGMQRNSWGRRKRSHEQEYRKFI